MSRQKTLFTICTFVLWMVLPVLAHAQRIDQLPATKKDFFQTASFSEGIAAVVNEDVITASELRNRLKLALLSSGVRDTPAVRQRLMPQVLNSLIEEQLQIQEGKNLGLHIPDEEVDASLKKVAHDNKIPGGDMIRFLERHGISGETLRAQIVATLTWNKVILRKVRPMISIDENEIESEAQRLRENTGRQEFLVSEIFLAFPENNAEQDSTHALAQQLVSQLKSGAVFGAVARQFSQGTGAGNGGDIGWLQLGELAPEIDEALQNMAPNEIRGPIKTDKGFHIIGLRNKRVLSFGDMSGIQVQAAQAFKALSPKTNEETLLEEGQQLSRTFHSCDEARRELQTSFLGWTWQDMKTASLDDMPSWLSAHIMNLNVGGASAPMWTGSGALVLFLCERTVPDTIDRNILRNMIGTKKMERRARRLLRDMRRDAFIEIRLKGL